MWRADLADVVRVAQAAMQHPWTYNQFAEELLYTKGVCLVAVADTVCGYAVFRLVGPEAELLQLAVEPEARRNGIGSFLLEYGIRNIRVTGADACFLEVRKKNRPARQFYSRFGFVEVGRRRKYYRQPVDDAVIMEMRMSRGEVDADNT